MDPSSAEAQNDVPAAAATLAALSAQAAAAGDSLPVDSLRTTEDCEGSEGLCDGSKRDSEVDCEGSKMNCECSKGGCEGSKGDCEGSKGDCEGSKGDCEGSKGDCEGSKGAGEGSKGGCEAAAAGPEQGAEDNGNVADATPGREEHVALAADERDASFRTLLTSTDLALKVSAASEGKPKDAVTEPPSEGHAHAQDSGHVTDASPVVEDHVTLAADERRESLGTLLANVSLALKLTAASKGKPDDSATASHGKDQAQADGSDERDASFRALLANTALALNIPAATERGPDNAANATACEAQAQTQRTRDWGASCSRLPASIARVADELCASENKCTSTGGANGPEGEANPETVSSPRTMLEQLQVLHGSLSYMYTWQSSQDGLRKTAATQDKPSRPAAGNNPGMPGLASTGTMSNSIAQEALAKNGMAGIPLALPRVTVPPPRPPPIPPPQPPPFPPTCTTQSTVHPALPLMIGNANGGDISSSARPVVLLSALARPQQVVPPTPPMPASGILAPSANPCRSTRQVCTAQLASVTHSALQPSSPVDRGRDAGDGFKQSSEVITADPKNCFKRTKVKSLSVPSKERSSGPDAAAATGQEIDRARENDDLPRLSRALARTDTGAEKSGPRREARAGNDRSRALLNTHTAPENCVAMRKDGQKPEKDSPARTGKRFEVPRNPLRVSPVANKVKEIGVSPRVEQAKVQAMQPVPNEVKASGGSPRADQAKVYAVQKMQPAMKELRIPIERVSMPTAGSAAANKDPGHAQASIKRFKVASQAIPRAKGASGKKQIVTPSEKPELNAKAGKCQVKGTDPACGEIRTATCSEKGRMPQGGSRNSCADTQPPKKVSQGRAESSQVSITKQIAKAVPRANEADILAGKRQEQVGHGKIQQEVPKNGVSAACVSKALRAPRLADDEMKGVSGLKAEAATSPSSQKPRPAQHSPKMSKGAKKASSPRQERVESPKDAPCGDKHAPTTAVGTDRKRAAACAATGRGSLRAEETAERATKRLKRDTLVGASPTQRAQSSKAAAEAPKRRVPKRREAEASRKHVPQYRKAEASIAGLNPARPIKKGSIGQEADALVKQVPRCSDVGVPGVRVQLPAALRLSARGRELMGVAAEPAESPAERQQREAQERKELANAAAAEAVHLFRLARAYGWDGVVPDDLLGAAKASKCQRSPHGSNGPEGYQFKASGSAKADKRSRQPNGKVPAEAKDDSASPRGADSDDEVLIGVSKRAPASKGDEELASLSCSPQAEASKRGLSGFHVHNGTPIAADPPPKCVTFRSVGGAVNGVQVQRGPVAGARMHGPMSVGSGKVASSGRLFLPRRGPLQKPPLKQRAGDKVGGNAGCKRPCLVAGKAGNSICR